MAFLNNRMTAYVAPDGFVYDYATPREDEKHLYVKYLYLTKFDNIRNYILVEDPYGTENKG